GFTPEQRKSLPVLARSVAWPSQLPAAWRRNPPVSGLVLKQGEIASSVWPHFVPHRDDSGHVLQHGPLMLAEIAAGEAAMIRWQGALHGRKHPAVAFCAIEPRQPQRRDQTPNQCESRRPAEQRADFPFPKPEQEQDPSRSQRHGNGKSKQLELRLEIYRQVSSQPGPFARMPSEHHLRPAPP